MSHEHENGRANSSVGTRPVSHAASGSGSGLFARGPFARGLFVTATDTDVGKTWITAMIARELRAQGHEVGVFKPACSGAVARSAGTQCSSPDQPSDELRWPDLDQLADAAGAADIDAICPLRFVAPLAPPVAAKREGREVDLDVIRHAFQRSRTAHEVLLVEGVGGLLCPLTETCSVADFALETTLRLIVVARLGLGTINHTLLTLQAAERAGLPVAGVILNDADGLADTPAGQTNPDELARRISVPLLGIVAREGQTACLRDRVTPARINWIRLAEGVPAQ